MALEHFLTTIEFFDSKKDETWKVIYYPYEEYTTVDVICNNIIIHKFRSIPEEVKSKAKHPNKTQAKALLMMAKKLVE